MSGASPSCRRRLQSLPCLVPASSLLEQGVEVATMVQHRDDPDLPFLDAVHDAVVRRDDELTIPRDPADAKLWHYATPVAHLVQRLDGRVESLVEHERGLNA